MLIGGGKGGTEDPVHGECDMVDRRGKGGTEAAVFEEECDMVDRRSILAALSCRLLSTRGATDDLLDVDRGDEHRR